MYHNTDDLRIRSQHPLLTPALVLQDLPASEKATEVVTTARKDAAKVISGQDDRLMVIVGPCSVHDTKAALEYAALLQKEAKKHAGELLVVMRVYFEKPRTTVGWKGLIMDPRLDGTDDIPEGLRRARVIKVKRKTPYPQLEIAPVVDEASNDLLGSTRDIARVLAFAENIVGELGEEAAPLMQRLRNLANQPGALADAAAGHLVADADTRRALLECLSQDQRIKAVADELARIDAQRKLDEQTGGEDTRGLN